MVKTLPASAGKASSIPGLSGSSGEGSGNPLQCSCLENPRTEEPGGLQSMGSQSRTRLSDLTTRTSSLALTPWHLDARLILPTWWGGVGDATVFPTSFQPASSPPGPGGRAHAGIRRGKADVLLQEACSVPGPHAWLCPEMGPREQARGEGRE